MQKVKSFYQNLWTYYREHLAKIHLWCLAAYAVLMLVVTVGVNYFVDMARVDQVREMVAQEASEEAIMAQLGIEIATPAARVADSQLEAAANKGAWYGLWYHNSMSNLLSIASGIVPGLFLAAWILVMNAVDWAATLGAVARLMGIAPWRLFLGAFAGHAIAEAAVNELGTAIGIWMCWLTSKQILRKNKPGEWKQGWIKAGQFWIGVIVPLLLICGLLEQYFTGWLSHKVLDPVMPEYGAQTEMVT